MSCKMGKSCSTECRIVSLSQHSTLSGYSRRIYYGGRAKDILQISRILNEFFSSVSASYRICLYQSYHRQTDKLRCMSFALPLIFTNETPRTMDCKAERNGEIIRDGETILSGRTGKSKGDGE